MGQSFFVGLDKLLMSLKMYTAVDLCKLPGFVLLLEVLKKLSNLILDFKGT